MTATALTLLDDRRRARALSGLALTATVLAALGAFVFSPRARAIERGPYEMEVLVDGRPLHELAGNGRTYVEAIPGREYALRLSNHTGRRVAIALAVDGLNTIDAKNTTPRSASKWILDPWETVTIEGWQTSQSAARKFFFTTEEASYGAWLGETQNLGLLSAVVYREVVPEAQMQRWSKDAPAAPRAVPAPSAAERRAEARPAEVPEGSAAGAGALGADAGRGPGGAETEAGATANRQRNELKDEYAATGIGREVDYRVEHVAFAAERMPAATLELRYEYRGALVKLGVLPPLPRRPSALDRREHARGFRDPGYAPDPYRGDGR